MRHYPVVANQTLAGEPLAFRIRELSRAGACRTSWASPRTWEARAGKRARSDSG